MRRVRKLSSHSRHDRPGFTLVEMMVAVTLVLLMMTMFAQIFQMAGSSISKQRGLAENDQRSRTLQTIIKADLDKRTFRWVYPFFPLEDTSAPESNIGKRQGFFYISENNPYSTVDDVLHFTVAATIKDRNKDDTPYYGVATNLGSFNYPNQPDADDGQLTVNNTGLSTIAEIVYFVRNGNLYRRQLLLREPLSAAGSSPQPTDASFNNPNGKDAFDPANAGTNNIPYTQYAFWRDFDYSAYYDNVTGSAKFLGADSLDNNKTSVTSIAALGNPSYRFGFSPPNTGSGLDGRPKEYSENSASGVFIGRYTMQECSDTDFRYPQGYSSGSNLPTHPTLTLTLDPNDYSVVGPDDFSGGLRRGEDLLMTNVHSFDVQVWDGSASLGGSFANIGDPALNTANPITGGGPSDYSMLNRLNNSYGPWLPANESQPTMSNAIFDTWNPQVEIDGSLGAKDYPPFHPLASASMATPPTLWTASNPYSAGTGKVFPNAFPTAGTPFYYRCIQSGTSGAVEPSSWPKVDGLTIPDGTCVWQAVDNRRPLLAIKIEIRFVDPSTQQMRQLTVVQSLVD